MLGACAMGAVTAQTVVFEDDFESYGEGAYVAENSDTWITWQANQEGTDQDVQTTTEYAQSGTLSTKYEGNAGPVDMVLPLGNFMGVHTVSWSTYIPSGFGGYFNGQEGATPGVGWAFENYYNDDGTITVIKDTETIATGAYPQDQWFDVSLWVDLDNDQAILTIDGNEIFDIVWDTPLGGINFYAAQGFTGGQGLYYIDDVMVTDMTVGIEELGYTPEFNVFPMPANDVLNLTWNFGNNVQATVYDLSGKTVIAEQLNGFGNAQLDVSALNEGVYFIQMVQDNLRLTKKIVVKH